MDERTPRLDASSSSKSLRAGSCRRVASGLYERKGNQDSNEPSNGSNVGAEIVNEIDKKN
jgi:hypothetical protein